MKLEIIRNGKLTPQQLRQELQQEQTSDLKRLRYSLVAGRYGKHDGGYFVADRHHQASS